MKNKKIIHENRKLKASGQQQQPEATIRRMLHSIGKLYNHKYSNKRVDIIITNENKITCEAAAAVAAGLSDATIQRGGFLKTVSVAVAIILTAQDTLSFSLLCPILF